MFDPLFQNYCIPNQSLQIQLMKLSNKFDFQLLIDVTCHTTLYLLEKVSSSEFLFEDPMSNRHRVKLGESIECSCHPGNLGHCIHSLYVLLRIYQLAPDDDVVRQTSYSGADIEQLSLREEKRRMRDAKTEEEKVIIKKALSKYSLLSKQWPEFKPDTVCPICYDAIENQTPVINCTDCQNYFHTKCLMVWASQREKQDCDVTCPMCRSYFGEREQIEERVKQQQIFFIKYHQSHEINCSICSKQILNKIYKCLLCVGIFLCSECYSGWKHQAHDKFIGKVSKRGEWAVSSRSQFNMSKLNASVEYLRGAEMKGSKLNLEALMGPKYHEFMERKVQKANMLEHLLGCFLDVEKEIHKTYKKIDFGEGEIKCCMCGRKNIVGMRRLPCKHFIDEKCLKFVLKGGFLQCPADKQAFLPGIIGEVIRIQ